MSIQVTLTIPEEVYRRAKRIARSSRREVADVLAEAIALDEPELESSSVVAREGEAFRRLHPELRQQYAGQFVAIHDEILVDHDWDQVALFLRVKGRFPAEFVWIAPVVESTEEVYHIRSPRLLRDGEM
jgi:hypothetical protein